MLLAEALALRADRQKKLKELSARIEDNARVPEGHTADEDPRALIEAAAEVAAELATLVERINRTNAGTVAGPEDAATISDLVARRDHAQRMTQLYRNAARAGTRAGAGRSWLSRGGDAATAAAVDVPALQRQADDWAVRYRDLDVRLQRLNWVTELND
jgi:hypothetical protein